MRILVGDMELAAEGAEADPVERQLLAGAGGAVVQGQCQQEGVAGVGME